MSENGLPLNAFHASWEFCPAIWMSDVLYEVLRLWHHEFWCQKRSTYFVGLPMPSGFRVSAYRIGQIMLVHGPWGKCLPHRPDNVCARGHWINAYRIGQIVFVHGAMG